MGCGCGDRQVAPVKDIYSSFMSGGARRRSLKSKKRRRSTRGARKTQKIEGKYSRKSSKKTNNKRYITGKQTVCHKHVIAYEMGLFKRGKLRSSNKVTVTNPRQAIAISLSVARKKCGPGTKRTSKKRSKSSRH